MIYAMSDLHGCYDLYLKMLGEIKFLESDTLYILGDILDRGKDGMKIIKDIKSRENVITLLGNHDFTAYKVLKRIYSPVPENENKPEYFNDSLTLFKNWTQDGGQVTYEDFGRLDDRGKAEFFEFIENMEAYEELEVGGNKFILSHAGLGNFKKNKLLSEYSLDDLIWARMDYNRTYFADKYIVSGHTPTKLIDKEYSSRIYRKNNHIAIDCGAVFLGLLGCIRLDDFKEFYVSKE